MSSWLWLLVMVVARLRFAVTSSTAEPTHMAGDHTEHSEGVQQHVIDDHVAHLHQTHHADAHKKGQDTAKGY